MSVSIQNDNYLVINFLCFRFPMENLRKINQNQKTCSLLIIFLKLKPYKAICLLSSRANFVFSTSFSFVLLVDCCTVIFNDTQVITFWLIEGSSSNLEYFVLFTNTDVYKDILLLALINWCFANTSFSLS